MKGIVHEHRGYKNVFSMSTVIFSECLPTYNSLLCKTVTLLPVDVSLFGIGHMLPTPPF